MKKCNIRAANICFLQSGIFHTTSSKTLRIASTLQVISFHNQGGCQICSSAEHAKIGEFSVNFQQNQGELSALRCLLIHLFPLKLKYCQLLWVLLLIVIHTNVLWGKPIKACRHFVNAICTSRSNLINSRSHLLVLNTLTLLFLAWKTRMAHKWAWSLYTSQAIASQRRKPGNKCLLCEPETQG